MPKPKAPRWTSRGDIPDIDPQTANDDQLELLDEDMLQLVDPSGLYTIDVGWYPAATRNGRFICRVIKANDWDRPADHVETASIKLVWKWLRQQIDEVTKCLGEVGTFTTRVGLFIYPRVASKSAKKSRSPRTPRIIPTYVRPVAPPAHIPQQLFSDRGQLHTTANPSTSNAMAIGLGEGLQLAHAA